MKMPDLHRYDARLWVVDSHLQAAWNAAIGIYETNPLSNDIPPLDALPDKIQDMRNDIASARRAADEKSKMRSD